MAKGLKSNNRNNSCRGKTPEGFLFSALNCGIKGKNLDLGMIHCKGYCKAVGFFTSNLNPSYSVVFSKKNVKEPIKAILTNSGNANCFSHKDGIKDTNEIISRVSEILGVKKKNILFASTGVIGKKLPKGKIISSLPKLIKGLSRSSDEFAGSILTTDTFKKISCAKVSLGKGKGAILGFAKGAGMISPNMATMLAFVLTDINFSYSDFRRIAKEAVDESFNSITVDGCMSTNDTAFFLSSGKMQIKNKKEVEAASSGIKKVCLNLAKMIIKDAEGATKFIEIQIKGAKTKNEAKAAGMAVANSNLFKTAVYGENANWGRIIAALGAAGIVVKENISIKATDLRKRDIKIVIDLKRGCGFSKVYTSDLTPKYIKINAEYS